MHGQASLSLFVRNKLIASQVDHRDTFPDKTTSHQSHPAKCGVFYCLELWGTPKLTAKQNTKRMSRRTIAIAAALSALALGSTLITANANPLFVQSFNQGVEKYEAGNYQGAIADYTKAIEINPQEAIPYYYRGDAKFNLQDYQGAIADYTKAIEMNPEYADAYNNRGIVKRYLKDYKGAIADYTKAIEINPQDVGAYTNRGIAKNGLKDYQGAIADYNKALEINPKDPIAYSNRGASKELLGDLKGACDDWRKAVDLGHQSAAQWVENQCS